MTCYLNRSTPQVRLKVYGSKGKYLGEFTTNISSSARYRSEVKSKYPDWEYYETV